MVTFGIQLLYDATLDSRTSVHPVLDDARKPLQQTYVSVVGHLLVAVFSLARADSRQGNPLVDMTCHLPQCKIC